MASNSRRPAAPAKVDALGERIEFEYAGHTFVVPVTQNWPVEALEAIEDEKGITFVRSLLGPSQWKAFKATNPTVAELSELADALAKAAGLGN